MEYSGVKHCTSAIWHWLKRPGRHMPASTSYFIWAARKGMTLSEVALTLRQPLKGLTAQGNTPSIRATRLSLKKGWVAHSHSHSSPPRWTLNLPFCILLRRAVTGVQWASPPGIKVVDERYSHGYSCSWHCNRYPSSLSSTIWLVASCPQIMPLLVSMFDLTAWSRPSSLKDWASCHHHVLLREKLLHKLLSCSITTGQWGSKRTSSGLPVSQTHYPCHHLLTIVSCLRGDRFHIWK